MHTVHPILNLAQVQASLGGETGIRTYIYPVRFDGQTSIAADHYYCLPPPSSSLSSSPSESALMLCRPISSPHPVTPSPQQHCQNSLGPLLTPSIESISWAGTHLQAPLIRLDAPPSPTLYRNSLSPSTFLAERGDRAHRTILYVYSRHTKWNIAAVNLRLAQKGGVERACLPRPCVSLGHYFFTLGSSLRCVRWASKHAQHTLKNFDHCFDNRDSKLKQSWVNMNRLAGVWRPLPLFWGSYHLIAPNSVPQASCIRAQRIESRCISGLGALHRALMIVCNQC